MSNHRKPHTGRYHSGYLRSPAWFARRTRWFTAHLDNNGEVGCAACGTTAVPRQLELHHADYTGVTTRGGRWIAAEADEDLVPLHPRRHELLHRLLDRDPILARHRTRRDATRQALHALARTTNLTAKGDPS